jgi:hypothetical protein
MGLNLHQGLKEILRQSGALSLMDRLGIRHSLSDAYRTLRDPVRTRQAWDTLTDLVEFRRHGRFLSGVPPPPPGGLKVLCGALTDSIAITKVQILLLKALQLRGCDPTILLSRYHRLIKPYYQAAGFTQFRVLEDHEIPQDEGEAAEEAARMLEAPTFQRLLNHRFRGVEVGKHLLSALLHQLRIGTVEFTPECMQWLERGLPSLLKSVRWTERVMAEVSPHLVLLSERGYPGFGAVFDIAMLRGLRPIQWNVTHEPDSVTLRKYDRTCSDTYVFSLTSESWRDAQRMPWSRAHEEAVLKTLEVGYKAGTWCDVSENTKFASKRELQERLGLDPAKKTAIIFTHVLWDGSFFDGVTLFEDYERWLVEITRAAAANTHVNWVIKLHPGYKWQVKLMGDQARPRDLIALKAQAGEWPPHVRILDFDTDISTFSLYQLADYGITVRGTVGIEMPCFGIPVFTGGTGRYIGRGFTVDSDTPSALLDKMAHIHQFPPLSDEQVELARRYAYTLLHRRTLKTPSFRTVEKTWPSSPHPLKWNVELKLQSLREFSEAPDLAAFARWAMDPSTGADYLREISSPSPSELRDHPGASLKGGS